MRTRSVFRRERQPLLLPQGLTSLGVLLLVLVGLPTPARAASVPAAPPNVQATAGDASADVSWTAPVDDGGSPVTGYTVVATPTSEVLCGCPQDSAFSKDVPAVTSTTIGLYDDVEYAITVRAVSAAGTGAASDPPARVVPRPPTPPGAPTFVSADREDGAALVSWQPPTDPGTASIDHYTVTATPDAGSTVTQDVSGTSTRLQPLVNGVTYAISVTATSAAGTGPAGSASVTPVALTTLTIGTDRVRLTPGQHYVVSGRLSGGEVAGRVITLHRVVAGSAPLVSTTTTGPDGRYSAGFSTSYSTSVTAAFAGTDAQRPSQAATVHLTVVPTVAVQHPIAENTRLVGRSLTVTGLVSPRLGGATVTLALRSPSGSRTLLTSRLDSQSHFTLVRSFTRGVYLLQVVVNATGRSGTGSSRLFRVYVD